jgi:nitrite reductase/ring-hydroxylating ferredoxin subunit
VHKGAFLTIMAGALPVAYYFSKPTEGAHSNAGAENSGEYLIEFAHELKDGDMRALKYGAQDSDKVLISKYQGKLYATGNACSHFGVPLEGGMLFDDKVLCPAHGAAFSITSGAPENAPALDGLPTFVIEERDSKFYVKVPEGSFPKKVAQ